MSLIYFKDTALTVCSYIPAEYERGIYCVAASFSPKQHELSIFTVAEMEV